MTTTNTTDQYIANFDPLTRLYFAAPGKHAGDSFVFDGAARPITLWRIDAAGVLWPVCYGVVDIDHDLTAVGDATQQAYAHGRTFPSVHDWLRWLGERAPAAKSRLKA